MLLDSIAHDGDLRKQTANTAVTKGRGGEISPAIVNLSPRYFHNNIEPKLLAACGFGT